MADADEQDIEQLPAYHPLAIIGAGPCGLSAAIYSTREDIATMVYERGIVGGLAGVTDLIENYPGFPDGVGGIELVDNMEKQARRFGAQFTTGLSIAGIEEVGRYKKLLTDGGDQYARAVLIATGSDYRKLGIPGEQELTGKGVHYCATCDGPLYRDKKLVVIGGGNSAMQESLFLTKFASHIDLLVRADALHGTEVLIKEVKENPAITIHFGVVAGEIVAENDRVAAVVGKDASGSNVRIDTTGVFVFIGLLPNTGWLNGSLKLDEYGFISTDENFMASIPGVYAAGDVRSGSTLQVASAVGEGVTAALKIREYLR